MSDNTYPQPVSDPEAEGLPDIADDDSTARDDVATGRIADGPDPAALPLDRDDRPLAVDQFGTTPEEARQGESLDHKIGREVRDPALDEAVIRADTVPSPVSAESFDPDAVAEDVDAVDRDTPLDDGGPVDPHLDSQVSMYDTGVGDRPVGRLVEPDEGLETDTESQSIAYDAGAAGGGASAEELAIHPVPDR
ncbi:DUF5709 domain-containing protein [Catenuloplanes atrovinosus]|uniref:DUF5709 domain-containing protein n=1 Tax=Catenuloplanes atrovinosus TaxID=137266 RepID=A0AAE4C8U2_9ACTN|nr:DUF5709 domain-containing protein [Catenuloplanes atrovinosus]MDR7275353.1 hypothetical protein [Catenuloplanes atrovinosus]